MPSRALPAAPPRDEEWRAASADPLQTVLRRVRPRRRRGRAAVRAVPGVPAGAPRPAHPAVRGIVETVQVARRRRAPDGAGDQQVGLDGREGPRARGARRPDPVDRRLRYLREPQAAPRAGRAGAGACWAFPPSEALFVGDSPHDVESGRAAGVYTVGVTWGAFTREEMEASGADVVIDRVERAPGRRGSLLRPDRLIFKPSRAVRVSHPVA